MTQHPASGRRYGVWAVAGAIAASGNAKSATATNARWRVILLVAAPQATPIGRPAHRFDGRALRLSQSRTHAPPIEFDIDRRDHYSRPYPNIRPSTAPEVDNYSDDTARLRICVTR